nr:YmaF family protein [bacterium]
MPLECRARHVNGHVHELQGSVKIAERASDPHNHRFATMTGEARPLGPNNHFHDVQFVTDTYEDHEHAFVGRTSGAIMVGDRHVHFLSDDTAPADGHTHEFRAATFMNDLIGD